MLGNKGCVIRNSDSRHVLIKPGTTQLVHQDFLEMTTMQTITIPDTVIKFGDDCFFGCQSLVHITLPSQIKEIPLNMFGRCQNLSHVVCPDGISRIHRHAFSRCSSLTSFRIPPGISVIELKTFWGCERLPAIEIPEGVVEIESEAFSKCRSLTYVKLPSSLSRIFFSAFGRCANLRVVVMPPGVEHVGRDVFLRCYLLQWIVLPDKFCTDAEKVRIGIHAGARCIRYSEFAGVFNINESLCRLGFDESFGPDDFKLCLDCSISDVVHVLQYRKLNMRDHHAQGFLAKLLGYSQMAGDVLSEQSLDTKLANLFDRVKFLFHTSVRDFLSQQAICKQSSSPLIESLSLFRREDEFFRNPSLFN